MERDCKPRPQQRLAYRTLAFMLHPKSRRIAC